MKKRIVIYLSMTPDAGGKYQYTLTILNGLASLDRQEYEIFAVYKNVNWANQIPATISNKIKSIERNIFSKIIRKIVLSMPAGLALWRVLSKYVDPLYKQLYSLSPSLIFYPGGDSVAYEFNMPGIIPIFDLMHRYESSFPEVSGKKIFKMREKHYSGVCKYATAILVDSGIGKKQVIESYKVSNEENIFVLPFIAPPYVRHQEDNINSFENYDLPQKYIFYPAQFWHHKNHLRLLKAIAQLKEKGTHVNAVFVGTKNNAYAEVLKQISNLKIDKQIFIFEYVKNNEIVFLYKNAVALVMPTFFGPTNIPPLEAFVLECPVITSNIYGIPEQLGAGALLVDPKDVNDLASKIELLWVNDEAREDLIAVGEKMSQKIYSEENHSLNISKIIKTLAK